MRGIFALVLTFAASQPAFASGGPFVSLHNTNFIVLLAFLLFVGVLIYLKVPPKLAGLLDRRAEGIKLELDEARALREEAQTILASYERKQKEVRDQAERIVEKAREDALVAAELAKEDLKSSIARRLAAAEDQIASAQASAVKEVRDQAINIAIASANTVIAKHMTATEADRLIDDAIGEVKAKLH